MSLKVNTIEWGHLLYFPQKLISGVGDSNPFMGSRNEKERQAPQIALVKLDPGILHVETVSPSMIID
jgi:hypothetical protein